MNTKKPFSNNEPSFEKRFIERERLMLPIINRLGNSVLVHAVDTKEKFLAIIKNGSISTPALTKQKKCPHLESFLGIDKTIYLSSGFVYATAYNFPYNFLFSMQILKKSSYYKSPLIYTSYLKAVNYLKTADATSLNELANINKHCAQVMRKFKDQGILEFWNIENELFSFIMNHKKKKKIISLIRENERKLLSPSYQAARKHARHNYATAKSPEILIHQNIDLHKSKAFLGVYIKKPLSKKPLLNLKKTFPGKIMYTGSTIKTL